MKNDNGERGQKFSKVIRNLCSPILRKKPEYIIFLDWDNIVGSLAHLCSPLKISISTGILYLQVERGAIFEVQYSEAKILAMVNSYLGKKLFTRIIIKQKNKYSEKEAKTNNIFTKMEFNINDQSVEEQLNRLWNCIK